jgi:hypothetical protein
MTREELRDAFTEGLGSLFKLEERLGPPGYDFRQRVYALRVRWASKACCPMRASSPENKFDDLTSVR